jgi:hypothetical protein
MHWVLRGGVVGTADWHRFFDSNPPWVIESTIRQAVDIGKVPPWLIETARAQAQQIQRGDQETDRGND